MIGFACHNLQAHLRHLGHPIVCQDGGRQDDSRMSQTAGYGTTAGQHEAGSDRHGASEQQPLMNGVGSRSLHPGSLVGRVRKAAQAEIRRDWADVVLIFCYIITGLLDSASISIWGSFVSMQTGKYCHKVSSPSPNLLAIFIPVLTHSELNRQHRLHRPGSLSTQPEHPLDQIRHLAPQLLHRLPRLQPLPPLLLPQTPRHPRRLLCRASPILRPRSSRRHLWTRRLRPR